MQRLSIVLLISATLLASGCSSRKYVRNTVNASSDALTARIETNEGQIKEVRDNVDQRISRVDSRVSTLESKTAEGLNSAQNADQHASQAQSAAERAAAGVNALDEKFQNRNQFNVSDEKSIQFKFNSAVLDKKYTDVLDEIANSLIQNPNAIIVLEGRTDSAGSRDYNVKLGERRVDVVKRYLAVEKSVPVYRIHEISFGSEKPVAENSTRDGREKNRAVTMTVMVPKSQGPVASRNN